MCQTSGIVRFVVWSDFLLCASLLPFPSPHFPPQKPDSGKSFAFQKRLVFLSPFLPSRSSTCLPLFSAYMYGSKKERRIHFWSNGTLEKKKRKRKKGRKPQEIFSLFFPLRKRRRRNLSSRGGKSCHRDSCVFVPTRKKLNGDVCCVRIYLRPDKDCAPFPAN